MAMGRWRACAWNRRVSVNFPTVAVAEVYEPLKKGATRYTKRVESARSHRFILGRLVEAPFTGPGQEFCSSHDRGCCKTQSNDLKSRQSGHQANKKPRAARFSGQYALDQPLCKPVLEFCNSHAPYFEQSAFSLPPFS